MLGNQIYLHNKRSHKLFTVITVAFQTCSKAELAGRGPEKVLVNVSEVSISLVLERVHMDMNLVIPKSYLHVDIKKSQQQQQKNLLHLTSRSA